MFIGTMADSLYLCDFDEISGNTSLLFTYEAPAPACIIIIVIKKKKKRRQKK